MRHIVKEPASAMTGRAPVFAKQAESMAIPRAFHRNQRTIHSADQHECLGVQITGSTIRRRMADHDLFRAHQLPFLAEHAANLVSSRKTEGKAGCKHADGGKHSLPHIRIHSQILTDARRRTEA